VYGNYGNQAPNMYSGYQLPQKQRHTGRRVVTWIIVVLVLLVALDFGAKAFAENEAAVQIQKQGFPRKPSVLIAGFPFLTQVITRHFDKITIKSGNFPAGPVTVSNLDVVASNVHLNSSFNGGTAGPLNGTVTIGLGAIGQALSVAGPFASFLGGGSQGLKIVAVGGNEIKGSLNLVGGAVSASATWQVVNDGPHEIKLHLVSSSGLPSSLLGKANNVAIPLSSLPAGLELTGGLNASSTGITAHVFADSLSFGS
jgi:LmeA-like phospholipid-binding